MHVEEKDVVEMAYEIMLEHHDTVVRSLRTLAEHAKTNAPSHFPGLEFAVEFTENAGAEIRKQGPERLAEIIRGLG